MSKDNKKKIINNNLKNTICEKAKSIAANKGNEENNRIEVQISKRCHFKKQYASG